MNSRFFHNPQENRLRIIAIANQKGGCGKTTVSVNLSSSLAFLGKKVLLIDLDPQGHSSLGLGVKLDNISRSIYDVLDDSGDQVFGVRDVRIVLSDHLHLIPSEVVLTAIEQKLAGAPERENRLLQKLQGLEAEYDFILIDCPPSLGLLTINGLVAADSILIPVQAEYYALEGLGQLIETIGQVQSYLKPELTILGAVLTMFESRLRLSNDVLQELYKHFDGKIFRSVIPRYVKLAEAPSFGKTIFHYEPNGKAAKAYERLARELIEHLSL